MVNFSIEIYSTPTCPDCKAAKKFFSQHNISYTEHDIAAHPEEAEALDQLTGKKIVPTILIGEKVLIGFAANREEIESDLLQ